MNQNAVQLLTRFWGADDETVKALCSEILSQAKLPPHWQPKNMREVSLYLATINSVLLEAVDAIADDLLLQAGQALLREQI